MSNVLYLWDWPTALGLVVVGFAFGVIAVPLAWPVRTAAHQSYPVGVAGVLMVTFGVVFFVFLIVFRLLTHVPNAERTIGTGLQWILFATVGLRWASGRRGTP